MDNPYSEHTVVCNVGYEWHLGPNMDHTMLHHCHTPSIHLAVHMVMTDMAVASYFYLLESTRTVRMHLQYIRSGICTSVYGIRLDILHLHRKQLHYMVARNDGCSKPYPLDSQSSVHIRVCSPSLDHPCSWANTCRLVCGCAWYIAC